MDRRLLEILANKPELIAEFPEWMLPASTIYEARNSDDVAIGEISGRDSIAAIIRACDTHPIKAVFPTINYAGTEFGRWEVPFEKVDVLKRILKERNIKVFEPVVLGSPQFWWKLCGRHVSHLIEKFGFYSPCIGCHLYFHAIRIPIAKKVGSRLVIGGERESHDGKIKLNQIGIALDAYSAFLLTFGIDLLLPLRHIASGEEVERIVGRDWDEGKEQLDCVLSKNYVELDGSVDVMEDAMKKFFNEFAVPVATDIVKEYVKIDKGQDSLE